MHLCPPAFLAKPNHLGACHSLRQHATGAMVVELRHGLASSQGPRSYMEDLTIVISDLGERLRSSKKGTTGNDNAPGGGDVDASEDNGTALPSPSAYYGVSQARGGKRLRSSAAHGVSDSRPGGLAPALGRRGPENLAS